MYSTQTDRQKTKPKAKAKAFLIKGNLENLAFLKGRVPASSPKPDPNASPDTCPRRLPSPTSPAPPSTASGDVSLRRDQVPVSSPGFNAPTNFDL